MDQQRKEDGDDRLHKLTHRCPDATATDQEQNSVDALCFFRLAREMSVVDGRCFEVTVRSYIFGQVLGAGTT